MKSDRLWLKSLLFIEIRSWFEYWMIKQTSQLISYVNSYQRDAVAKPWAEDQGASEQPWQIDSLVCIKHSPSESRAFNEIKHYYWISVIILSARSGIRLTYPDNTMVD